LAVFAVTANFVVVVATGGAGDGRQREGVHNQRT
jgi:hypothetical protein